jgi:hypothetical protein
VWLHVKVNEIALVNGFQGSGSAEEDLRERQRETERERKRERG